MSLFRRIPTIRRRPRLKPHTNGVFSRGVIAARVWHKHLDRAQAALTRYMDSCGRDTDALQEFQDQNVAMMEARRVQDREFARAMRALGL